jgi:hypothetical protein
MSDRKKESMPCPRCGKQHEKGEYRPQPGQAQKPLGDLVVGKDGNPHPPGHRLHGVRSGTPFGPDDVTCECGAVLRHTVPVFAVGPYGWHWRIL